MGVMNNERSSETGKSEIDPVFKQVITAFFQVWGINIQKEKSQKIIEEIVKSGQGEYVQYAYLLRPKITEEIAMPNRFRLPRRNMELIAQYLGRDLLPFISNEDRVRDLTPTQRLQGLTLEDRLDGLSDEERQALLKLRADQGSDT